MCNLLFLPILHLCTNPIFIHNHNLALSMCNLSLFLAAVDCTKPHPTIYGGNATTLESTDTDIQGAQVNYSCNNGCELEGSNSLRCSVKVIAGLLQSEWVDDRGDTGVVTTPSCSCYG